MGGHGGCALTGTASGRLILLNGASSSGKTTLARALQGALPGLWLHFGIDDLVDALPPALGDGITFGSGGAVSVGAAFRRAEAAWMRGVAATVRAGVNAVVDDVFLGGGASQERWRAALAGLPVLWVGVHCDPAEAERREGTRPDRAAGMHRQQAGAVHRGVRYDAEVDTSRRTPQELAAHLGRVLGLTASAG